MDPITIIGIVLAFVAVFGSILMEGGDAMAIFLPSPMLLVFLGTISVAIAGGVMNDAIAFPKNAIAAILAKKVTCDDAIETLVALAERARREGLLALEAEVGAIEDPFLRKGLELAVDGTDPEQVEEILSAEIAAKKAADKVGAKLFSDMAGYAPTIGIIGTVTGLVHVLGNLANPAELGGQIASAFVATLWGIMSANIMWMPIANRLSRVQKMQADRMELCLEGVLAIQAGANPRLIARKLNSLLPPSTAKSDEAA